MDAALSKLAAGMVAKYGRTVTAKGCCDNMGAAILFDDYCQVADVRSWMDKTRFVKKGSRMYLMEINGYLVRAEKV